MHTHTPTLAGPGGGAPAAAHRDDCDRPRLSQNDLTTIPLDFGKQLHNLRRLNLARNRIAIIPSGVTMPPKLEELNIGFNQLRCV